MLWFPKRVLASTGENIVQFEAGDYQNLTVTPDSVLEIDLKVTVDTPTPPANTHYCAEGANTYIRITTTGRHTIRIEDSANNILVNWTEASGDAAIVGDVYEFRVRATATDVTAEVNKNGGGFVTVGSATGLSVASWRAPDHINGNNPSGGSGGSWQCHGMRLANGGGDYFNQFGNAAAWNAGLSAGAVTDV